MQKTKIPKTYLCSECKHNHTKPLCDILRIYQVVVYDCVCLEYEPKPDLMNLHRRELAE